MVIEKECKAIKSIERLQKKTGIDVTCLEAVWAETEPKELGKYFYKAKIIDGQKIKEKVKRVRVVIDVREKCEKLLLWNTESQYND